MSDETPQPPNPPGKPTSKTSTVPLKKETVRITLRAKPGAEGAPAPGAAPPPPRPPAPAPPAPPAPPAAAAPPAPPAPPSGAKTVPLTPAPPAGAPSAPLAQPTARLQPAPGAAPPAAPGTRPLPKATVKLQPTQPVSSAPSAAISSAPMSTGRLSGELDDDGEETGIMPFAVICLVLALAAFAIELIGSQKVFKQDETGSPSWAVPAPNYKGKNSYEKLQPATDEVVLSYNFPSDLPTRLKIKEYKDFKTEKQN